MICSLNRIWRLPLFLSAAGLSACQSLSGAFGGAAAPAPDPPPALEAPNGALADSVARPRLKPDRNAEAEEAAAAAAAEMSADAESVSGPAPEAGLSAFPPSRLIGASREGVRNRLGAPSAIRVDAPAVTWLYESPDCALSVSFYSTVDGIEYKALQYRIRAREASLTPAAPFDDLDCIRSILAGRDRD